VAQGVGPEFKHQHCKKKKKAQKALEDGAVAHPHQRLFLTFLILKYVNSLPQVHATSGVHSKQEEGFQL
jgi:hypothetical protein